MIKKIVNYDFKSYAGEVVLGPFDYCFSAIIGPNGSGKSNVIDSILFVFGYRANKVRAKKLAAMIHSSAKHPNCQSCSVEMHFVECDDSIPDQYSDIPGTEFRIGRKAFKDNTSYYTINGKQTQFKPVADMLKKYHVDLRNNRFLILQGEVEQIAMMKSKGQSENETGMLEYLEDIVGTNRYVSPLVKLVAKVEELSNERAEKHNRCNMAERDMKDLEGPHNENVIYLLAENELIRCKSQLLQRQIFDCKKQIIEVTSRKDDVENDLKMHDEMIENVKKQRKEKEHLVKEENSKYEKMVKNKEDMENQLKLAEKNKTEVQTTLEALNKRRKENKVQLVKLASKIDDLKLVPEKNRNEMEECEKKIERLGKQKADLEEQLQKNYTKLEDQTKPLIEEREILQTELIELQRRVDETKAELKLAESEMKILKSDETTEKRKYENLRISYEESKNDLEAKIAKMEELRKELPEFGDALNKMNYELQKHKEEEIKLRNELIVIKGEINEKVNSMQSSRSNNKVLDSLMRQKTEGNIPGIMGRLGDLGGIDKRYDVAISTACSRLDCVIVDTVNTAQQSIEHLKKHDVGRGTFVALEKVDYLMDQCRRQIQTPQNVPRLFDLVKVEDERILPAFYFALRNTLVSNDLEQGTKIAYGAQRYRVVTLSGEVIETSGTMSGGGKTQMKGKMGQKVTTKTAESANTSIVSQKDIEEIQRHADDLQSRINFCQEEQGRLEKEIHQVKQNHHIKEAELNKLQISAKSLEEQMPRLEIQLKNQKHRMEKTTSDATKVASLEKQISEKRELFEESEANAKTVTTKIDAINKKVNDIHGECVKSVNTKITSTGKQITTLTNNVSKLKVEVSTSERNIKKIEKQIEDMTADISNSEQEIRKLVGDREQYEEDLTEWNSKIEIAKKEIEETNRDSSSVQREIIALTQKETDGKVLRFEIEKKQKALKEELAQCKSQIPHIEKQIQPLTIIEIPGSTEPAEALVRLSDEQLENMDIEAIQRKKSENKKILGEKKANISLIEEYLQKREIYMERVKVLEDITTKRNAMRATFEDVRTKRYREFTAGFSVITRRLKEMYRMITQGGDAELELVDSMDPFNEGISFTVRPNKKSWKNISNLSGGEKTLASLALVFALHYYKPSPLYFMDEIDAALDFKNISIVAHYIKERTKNAQFIIISLRSNMFELCDFLIGIYKVHDCTDTVCLKNEVPQLEDVPPQEDELDEFEIEEDLADTTVQPSEPESQMEVSSNNQEEDNQMDTSTAPDKVLE